MKIIPQVFCWIMITSNVTRIADDLRQQKELDPAPKAIRQIEFVGQS